MPTDAKPRSVAPDTPSEVASSRRDESFSLRDYRSGDEKQIVAALNGVHAAEWGDERLWYWKHRDRPGFRSEEVLTAQGESGAVACFHGAVLPIKLEEGLEVLMSFDGDFAVLPEFRRLGIPLAAHDLTEGRLLARGVALRGGFTSRELNQRFYHKQFGYVFVRSRTEQFSKILAPSALQPRVARLSEALPHRLLAALERTPIVIDLRIRDFPDHHLECSGAGLHLGEGRAGSPHLVVHARYTVMAALASGALAFVRAVLANLLTCRLRVGGLVRAAPLLARLLGSIAAGGPSR